MTQKKIPVWLAVVINMNVMIGAGVFVNPAPLAQLAGPLSGLSYVGITIIMMPLVLVVAQLAYLYPDAPGGMYYYSKQAISPFAGIISGGSYFLAKTISTAVLMTVFARYVHELFPGFIVIPALYISLGTLLIFCFLNMFGARFGGGMQLLFVILKMTPLIFALFLGFFVINKSHFVAPYSSFSASLPVALYALLGFESCCALGPVIQGGEKSVAKVLVISFVVVATLFTFFQTTLFGTLGVALGGIDTPLGAFSLEVSRIFPGLGAIMRPLLNSAVMLAVLGACYGVLFANCWNAYAIFQEISHTGIGQILISRNRFGIPTYCVGLQGLVSGLLLWQNVNIITLARMTVLGMVIAYLVSAIAMVVSYGKDHGKKITLPYSIAVLGLGSSSYIGFYCIRGLLGM